MNTALGWEHIINRGFSSWMLYFCRYWGSLPRRHIVNIGQNSCVAHEDRRNEYYSPTAEKLGHGLARELFIMWLAVGCLQSWSICSSSVLLWALQLPLSSTAFNYGLLDGNAVLKRLRNTDARIWEPLKARCSRDISLKRTRNQMASFFGVACMTSSYMQTRYICIYWNWKDSRSISNSNSLPLVFSCCSLRIDHGIFYIQQRKARLLERHQKFPASSFLSLFSLNKEKVTVMITDSIYCSAGLKYVTKSIFLDLVQTEEGQKPQENKNP